MQQIDLDGDRIPESARADVKAAFAKGESSILLNSVEITENNSDTQSEEDNALPPIACVHKNKHSTMTVKPNTTPTSLDNKSNNNQSGEEHLQADRRSTTLNDQMEVDQPNPEAVREKQKGVGKLTPVGSPVLVVGGAQFVQRCESDSSDNDEDFHWSQATPPTALSDNNGVLLGFPATTPVYRKLTDLSDNDGVLLGSPATTPAYRKPSVSAEIFKKPKASVFPSNNAKEHAETCEKATGLNTLKARQPDNTATSGKQKQVCQQPSTPVENTALIVGGTQLNQSGGSAPCSNDENLLGSKEHAETCEKATGTALIVGGTQLNQSGESAPCSNDENLLGSKEHAETCEKATGLDTLKARQPDNTATSGKTGTKPAKTVTQHEPPPADKLPAKPQTIGLPGENTLDSNKEPTLNEPTHVSTMTKKHKHTLPSTIHIRLNKNDTTEKHDNNLQEPTALQSTDQESDDNSVTVVSNKS